MIKSVAELLKAFADEERKKLDAQQIEHAPTIGAMYERLTKELLSRSIPEELGLRVVQGFAYFGEKQSGQLDCMLVRGAGEQIPHTDSYRWPVKDVIAVFEVKKTLSAAELADSYFHLRDVLLLYSDYAQGDEAKGIGVDLSWPRRVFSQITGIVAPAHTEVDKLPFDLEMIYHTLVTEFLSPIRIVVGHHGWKKESTLRDHAAKLLEDRLSNPSGMGVGSFPQLIIGGEFALVKANGFPYAPSLIEGMWPFLLSTSHNPIGVMLELLFTRLDSIYKTKLAVDQTIEREAMSPCLRARAARVGDRAGWEYMYDAIQEKTLQERGTSYEWRPAELSSGQFTVISRLCNGGSVNITDPHFLEFANNEQGGAEAFVRSLTDTQLVAVRGNELVLTTQLCQVVFTREGCFAAENNAGQLTAWLESISGKPREEWSVLVARTAPGDAELPNQGT